MRRALSVIVFVIGGWLLMVEPLIAFIDFGSGPRFATPLVILIVFSLGGVPLAIATALSPGDRRRELGLTVLLSAGAVVLCGLSVAAVFLDPGFKPFLADIGPMPDIVVAPALGIVNLAVLTGIGWLLYRRPGERHRSDGATTRW